MLLTRMQLKVLKGSAALLLAIVLLLINVVPALGVDYSLTVTKDGSGAGSGTVASNPTGIDCGSTCSFSFTEGTPVTLTATHSIGAYFAGWSGEGCTGTGTCVVTMDAVRSVTATFTADSTPPTISIGAPSATITAGGPVTYTVTYADANFNTSTLAPGDISLNKTGTANGTVGVTGTGLTRTVTISSITGDGTLGISIAAGTASDLAGNTAPGAGPSTTFMVDTTAPTISIGAPSATITKNSSVTYTVTYADTNFNTSTLAPGNISLNKTGTANGTVGVTGTGLTRTVTISSITGDGTLGISIAAGTASDLVGNTAPGAGPSTTFMVDNTAPTISIGAPSVSATKNGPVTYTVTYADANFNTSTLVTGNISLNKTGTANGTVGVTGTGLTRTVTISSITGDGTLGISIAAGTASDLAGNTAPAAGPSTTFMVDNTAPTISIGAPSATITAGGPVTYTITYADANFNTSTLAPGNISLNKTGTANGTVGVTGTGLTRTVTISSITGDGTLGISIAAGTASDLAGNTAPGAGPSTTFMVDTTAPTISIGAPSATITAGGPVTYTVTYADTNFNTSTLAPGNISLNKTGTANGTVGVTGTGLTRTVTISSITGDGTLGISIAAGTASDLAGNTAPGAGPSTTFMVDTTAPTISIGAPSATITKNSSVTYTVTYADTNFNTSTLATGDISLNKTGTANGTVGVTGTGLTRTVTISSITGDGTLGISIAAGTASDLVGNTAPGAGPSTTFVVDNTAPTISIGAPSVSATKNGPVTYTVTYADTNFNTSTLATGDISLNKTGTANGTVGVTGTGLTRTVTISSITGDGTLGISIATGTASDLVGNTAPGAGPSTTFVLDNTAPTISIGAPSVSATRSGPVTYTVTYADTNFNASTLATGDISLNKTGTANGTVGVTGTGLTRTVTISSITGDGTLGISIAAGTASDLAGNTAPGAGPSTTFMVDNTAPTISIGAPSATITAGGPVTYTVTYADTNFNASMLAPGNISLNKTGTANGTVGVTGTGLTRTVTISSITGDGTLGISIAAGTASDLAGNTAPGAGPSTTFMVDTTAPTISIGAPSATITKNSSVTYTVTYADTNFNASTLATGNISLNKTGTANGTVGITGTGLTRTVTISSITGDGTLGISIAAGTASDLAGNTAPAAGPSTTFVVDNTAPTISIGAPSVSAAKNGPVTYTVTYADAHFNASTLAPANITLNKTGDATGSLGVTGSGLTRTVTINNISGNGTLGISIAGATASDTAGNLAPAAGPSTTFAVDTTLPSLSWIYPPPCGSPPCYYSVSNQRIQLTVAASDIVGISKVVFRRWDKNALVWVDITTLYNSPYSFSFDTTTLLPEWNQITVRAYDTANNIAESYIFLNHDPFWVISLPLIQR